MAVMWSVFYTALHLCILYYTVLYYTLLYWPVIDSVEEGGVIQLHKKIRKHLGLPEGFAIINNRWYFGLHPLYLVFRPSYTISSI